MFDKRALLDKLIDEFFFVQCPPDRRRSYDADGSPLVYEITGNCYDSPGAPKRWNTAIHNVLIELNYVQSTVDPCLYSKVGKHTLVYTDDFCRRTLTHLKVERCMMS